MVRTIWSGSISFGLVNIPVKVVKAVDTKDVRFHQLHDADGARIEYKRVCSAEGEEVPYEHIVKGYKLGADRYVVLTPEELEAVDPEATHRVDILDFVDLPEVDPIYFEKPYYLVPDKASAKPYALLAEAMRRSNRVAVGRVVLRTKEHLVLLRPYEDALTMTTLVYHDELVRPEDVDALAEVREPPGERELAMAQQLIDALSTSFDPARYRDRHRERILELIEQKAEGQEVVLPPPAPAAERPVDLVAALEASLEATRRRGGAEA